MGATNSRVCRLENENFERPVQFSENKIRKVILIGAGDGAKSTFFKQVQHLLGKGFTNDEIVSYKDKIRVNMVQGVQTLCQISGKLGLGVEQKNKQLHDEFMAIYVYEYLITPTILWDRACHYLKPLWHDQMLQEAYKRRVPHQFPVTMEYYLNSIDRILPSHYVPNINDVLNVRIKTTGIVETEVLIKNVLVRFNDIGGQRNERKKWIHCFDGKDVFIYCMALSEINEVCYEDDKTNRMLESLRCFEELSSSTDYIPLHVPFILFMSQVDLFAKKILSGTPIVHVFPDYNKDYLRDPDLAIRHILKEFEKRNVKGRKLFPVAGNTIDCKSMTQVFHHIEKVILTGDDPSFTFKIFADLSLTAGLPTMLTLTKFADILVKFV
jgi:hypothetical protein